MLSLKEQYDLATPPIVAAVRGTADAQLDLPTPCAEFDVRSLLGHLQWLVNTLPKAARGGAFDLVPMVEPLEVDWREHFATGAWELAEAWTDPQTLERPDIGGMPASVMARLPLTDFVVHAWDLTRATGQPLEVDPELTETTLEFMERLAPQGRQQGVFAEEVAVPTDAPAFDKLLAASGRDPHWNPK